MNQNLIDLEAAIAEAMTHAHISRYLPNLESENPARCLLLYVTQPTRESEVSECVTVETPVELGLRMIGGLRPEEIIGIFQLHEADEAVCLAEWALEEAQKLRCRKCGQPYGPDADGSPGVLQHWLDDGSDEVDYDRDEDHVPVPE